MDKLALGSLGILIVLVVCSDVFQTVIVPRLTLRRFRVAPILVGRILWPLFRHSVFSLPEDWRTGLLEAFAPFAFITLLATWLGAMISGFALIFYSLGDFVQPHIASPLDALYFAGTSVLTLGFGDVVAAQWPARAVVLLAAVLGLIFMALVVSLLFSMLSYLQERESVINTLMSRAGVPPSGVVLLMRYRELGIMQSLATSFVGWEIWLASILESHRSFPLLIYFRSTSPTNSWLATVGATMDAAALLLTSIEGDWVGEADLYYWMGVAALKAIAENFDINATADQTIDKEQFKTALELLEHAGFKVRDAEKSWPYFQARRAGYMKHLIPIAKRFESPLNEWLPAFRKL